MNLSGVTPKDVGAGIAPVRQATFKSRGRRANALSAKVLERVVEISTVPGGGRSVRE